MAGRHQPEFPMKTMIVLDRLRRFLKNPMDDSLLLYVLSWILGALALYALSIAIR